ncbi:hypothetical protein, partial [Hyphomonas sp.]|uniref:hypothetical protein n=1 Tax=Hyphomonas sp. TaxID=87 RepID=UPI0037BE2414
TVSETILSLITRTSPPIIRISNSNFLKGFSRIDGPAVRRRYSTSMYLENPMSSPFADCLAKVCLLV